LLKKIVGWDLNCGS
jgi:hypothetical protein